ncbi:invasin domain 3-containing protein [Shewanella marisflavi]|uniref:invasin domain 3-containing protein n=1 Tax=Shewanella marisflavi TaxID=260364 RepID=UPI003AAC2E47
MKSAFKVFTSYLFLLFIVACSGGGSVTDDGSGGAPTPGEDVYALTLALVNGSGEPTTDISNAQPGKLHATLTKNSSPFPGARIVFALEGEGGLTPDSGVTDSAGKVVIDVLPGDKLGSGKITASVEIESGKSVEASISFNTQGDGGAPTGGAQVALILVDDLTSMTPISTISSLSPGYLVATVSGITKATIVKFSSDIGELPIETAATEDGKAYVQILAGTQPGAGIATATLVTGEKAELVFKVGATNVLMGSGDPFQSEIAAVSPSVVSAGGTASISVTLQDDAGNPFTEPVEVKFSSVCANKTPAEAEISTPVVAVNGVATTTYLAKGCVGDDAINVNAVVGSKSLSAKATVNVLPASVGSIKFVEAVPEIIRLKGTGGAESSTVKFQVMDNNGNPVSNQRVNFSLNSDTGDIVLDPLTATTNSQGIVQTVVNSGSVATSVRVTAVVDGSSPEISSQSNLLVISTGLPDQDSFSLSANILNPEGWDYDGVEVSITARLADAFNNPVPDGTAVSFTTEGGVIDSSCTTQGGVCSVTWSSQNPRPTGKTLFDLGQEPSLGADIGQPYGGRVTILARAIGEESFPDLNGNGRFDLAEFDGFKGNDVSGNPYDLDEAFVDHNEDGLFNPKFDGEAGGDAETFVDFNNNKEFDVADGVYNGSLCSLDANNTPHAGCSAANKSLDVRASLVLVMSGSSAVASTPIIVDSCIEDGTDTDPCKGLNGNQTLDILGKSTGGVSIIIGDLHNQPLPAGTVITFTPSAGSLASKGSYTVESTNVNSSIPYSVTIKGAEQPDAGTLIIEATTPKGDVTELATIPIVIH